MKISIVLVILCIYPSSFVLTRDQNEVIEAFRPLILELHNILGRETGQLVYNEDGQHRLKHFEDTINYLNQSMTGILSAIKDSINQKVKAIVSETGMASHEDLIQHCYGKKDDEVAGLQAIASSGRDICVKLASMDLKNLNRTLIDMTGKQYELHRELEDSLRSCNRSSNNGMDMTSCMVSEYLYELPSRIGQTWFGMRQNITAVEPSIMDREKSAQECFTLVTDRAKVSMEPITEHFRKCCVAAAEHGHLG